MAGNLIGAYLRMVGATSRLSTNPEDLAGMADPDLPFILTAWHGEHLLLPMLNRPEYRMTAMVSRHRDGELNAIALKWFGVDAIRGAGSHNRDIFRKGAFQAFRGLMSELHDGRCVFMTGDVPKVARVASPGIVRLAARTGRPIYPVGIAVSRHIATSGWDRAAVPLPFSHVAIALTEVIRVPVDADENAQDTARERLQTALDDASDKAWAMAGAPSPYALSRSACGGGAKG